MNGQNETAGWDSVQIAAGDHVAVALRDLSGSVRVRQEERVVVVALREPVPLGHKFALFDLPEGSEICKYGAPIGRLTQPVRKGEHVHVHNLESQRARSRS